MKENQFEETMIDLTDIIENQLGINTRSIHLKGVRQNNNGDWEIQVDILPYRTLQSIEINFNLTPNGVDWGESDG